jgi:inner membrane protein
MPTPIGHMLSGALVYQLFRKEKSEALKVFLSCAFLTILPDVDFLFGFIQGNPNKYHHHFTHSIAFVLVSAVVMLLFFRKSKTGLLTITALFVCSGLLHLGLDMLAVDNTAPRGVPLFWPISNHYFISPVIVFSDVSRASQSSVFFQSLFNMHNVRTVMVELILLGPLTCGVFWMKKFIRVRHD